MLRFQPVLLLAWMFAIFLDVASFSRDMVKVPRTTRLFVETNAVSHDEPSLQAKRAQIPLKVAIAGGGVGGVMLAYALELKGFDFTVFE